MKIKAVDYKNLAKSQSFYALPNSLNLLRFNRLSKQQQTVYLINSFNIGVVSHYMRYPNQPLSLSQKIPFMSSGHSFEEVIKQLKKQNPSLLLTLCTADIRSPQLRAYSSQNFDKEFNSQKQRFIKRSIHIIDSEHKLKVFPWYKQMGISKDIILKQYLGKTNSNNYELSYTPHKWQLNSL